MVASAFDLRGKSVYVAGHRGMVGSAISRRLESEECVVRTVDRNDVDLTKSLQVTDWLNQVRPHVVVLAAAKVGGIGANSAYPTDFIIDNIEIALNVIRSAYKCGVEKLLFLSSSCVYPRLAPQPMSEDQLFTGPLEPTNESYAVAKIAGMKLVEAYRHQYGADFVSVVPTNLYGPGDYYHPEYSHVPAALIQRFHEGKMAAAPFVSIWGTGQARREFLAVDDLADACVFLLKHYSGNEAVNVGTGEDITIADFARIVSKIVGYRGQTIFDTSRPDGMPRKLLDVSKLAKLGWISKTKLEDGLARAYEDYLAGGGRQVR